MAEASSRAMAAALAGRRVLLADDSPYIRKAVAAYLKDAGADVVEADDGGAALTLLRTHGGFHAALLDIQMPGLGGLDTARAIRRAGQPWSGLPLVALTADSQEAAAAAAHAAGMNAFLAKPVQAAALYRTLASLLAGQPEGRAMVNGTAAQPAGADGLLNLLRLESYRRLGLLGELLGDYLPEIRRLLGDLDQAVHRNDTEASLDALHSLLGMAGEAGALALHQRVRQVYVPLRESRSWPDDAGWLSRMRELAERTERALHHHLSARSSADAS